MHIRTTSPQGQFEIKEHIAFCFTCISKHFPSNNKSVFCLKEVYDFKIAEIAQILDNAEHMVKYICVRAGLK